MTYAEIQRTLRIVRKIWGRYSEGRPRDRVLRELGLETNLAGLPWTTQIVGYGIGPKIKERKRLDTWALRFYVRRKIAPSRLGKDDLIPKRLHLKVAGKYLVTDVITQTRPFVAQVAVQPGDRVSHLAGKAGLIGLGVRSTNGGGLLILSCSHVLAPRNHLRPGVNIIESPPLPSPTNPTNRIGELASFKLEIDAATCRPDAGVTFPIASVDGTTIRSLFDPENLGLRGRKVWRLDRSGTRVEGTLESFDDQEVDLHDGQAPVQFTRVIRYKTPNSRGDSGGAVIDQATNQLVGLHFAGDGSNTGLISQALPIFRSLRIKLQ
jgi:hypothetical protein